MNLSKLRIIAINFILLFFSLIISLLFIEIILGSVKSYRVDLKRFENKIILFIGINFLLDI